MARKSLLSMFMAGVLVYSVQVAFAQSAQRIEQAVIINGQQVRGVTVIQNGAVQDYSCPTPQEYVAADQSSQGWACFDQATGTWLLHAVVPQQQAVNVYDQQPVYQDVPSAYGYYGYPYPYPYNYYPYPYYGWPAFQFGFGFGHAFVGPHFHGHADGSFGHGGFAHGPVGHGSFGHDGGAHMGGFGGGMHGGGMHGGGMHGGGHR